MTDIGKVLNEHEVLLTGANGFLGKIIFGLLLDRYPGLKHLHLLLRPGKGLTAPERFDREVLGSPALAFLDKQWTRDALAAKITVWPGDIGEADCGLDAVARHEIASRVSLIINCAGKVDFFPPVDDSFHSNVDGVENVVTLALAADAKLLHVSTAFVCGEADGLVEESDPVPGFYPRRQGPEDQNFHHAVEIDHCRKMIGQIYRSAKEEAEAGHNKKRSREAIERLTALGRQRAAGWGWTNTYTYAKSLGEQVIASTEGLSYAIVRPAIVESAWRFPFPGWIEGGRTSAPLVLMALDGQREWPARRDAALEVIPVDMVAAAVIVISGLLLGGKAASVYQLGSSDVNPIELEPLVKLLGHFAGVAGQGFSNRKARPAVPRWIVGQGGRPGTVRFLTPAQYHERGVQLRRKIRRAEGVVRRLERALGKAGMIRPQRFRAWKMALRAMDLQITFREQTLDQYLPFIMHNRYVFESENIRVARAEVSPKDRKLLQWAPEEIQWKDYWIHHQIAGIKKWVEPEAVRNWAFRI